MNKFEEWAWERGVKDSLFGRSFLLNQEWCRFVKEFLRAFNLKQITIKKHRRISEFIYGE